MGCDIHAHAEVKINGVWHHHNAPNLERNYNLFSRMANVRNNGSIDPISDPRGLPEDVCFETKFDSDHWNGDGHSHSWLSGEEMEALCDWVDAEHKKHSDSWYSFKHRQVGCIFGNGWNVHKYPHDYPKGVEDARLVFWFDN